MMEPRVSCRPLRPGAARPVISSSRRGHPDHALETSLSLLLGRSGSPQSPAATAMLTAAGVVSGTLLRSRCRGFAAPPVGPPLLPLGTAAENEH